MSAEIIYKELIKKRLASEKLKFLRAPGRVNIIGEHTDYNQGLCLAGAFQKAIYFGFAPSGETEIISLKYNESWFPKSQHKMPDWAIYFKGGWDLLRQKGYSWPEFKLAFDGDLPVGSGLSSSSAIRCGFIYLLNELGSLGLSIDKLTEYAVVAEKASGLEGGMMDQISIFNGKKEQVLLIQCSDWNFKYIPVPEGPVSWMVVDTKVNHQLVYTDYNNRSRACKELLNTAQKLFSGLTNLSELTWDQITLLKESVSRQHLNFLIYINEENQRVLEMIDYFELKQFESIGQCLMRGHEGLRKLYQVSCKELDFLVDYAKNSELAFGARMMGGGFGGATIHLIPENLKDTYSKGIANAFLNRFAYQPDVFEVSFEEGIQLI